MPGVRKQKECPVCNKIHRRRGIHCSASCAASARIHDVDTKEKISESMRDFYDTPQGIAQSIVNGRRNSALLTGGTPPVTIDEFCVDIPTLYDIPEGYLTDL